MGTFSRSVEPLKLPIFCLDTKEAWSAASTALWLSWRRSDACETKKSSIPGTRWDNCKTQEEERSRYLQRFLPGQNRGMFRNSSYEGVKDFMDTLLEEADTEFQRSLKRARREVKRGRYLTHTELKLALANKKLR